ncbi:MAG: AAA family ATPase [Candidatus Micrarchaeia archaeon]
MRSKENKNISGVGIAKKLKRNKNVARRTPMSIYWLKDVIKKFVSHANFPDALATVFALTSISFALPFFPIPVIILLLVLTFILTMVHPLIGLMALLFESLPMFIFQAPLLAWLFAIFMGIAFSFGFKHYRTITFIYMLMALPFSSLGYFLEIPAFVLTIMVVGTKRGMISAIVAVLLVASISGLTNIQNTGSIAFNASLAHSVINSSPYIGYFMASKPMPSLSNISSAWSSSLDEFFSFKVTGSITDALFLSSLSISSQLANVGIEIVLWAIVVIIMGNYVISSRSKYKGSVASTFSVLIPIAYVALSYFTNSPYNFYPFIGFIITPFVLLFLELNDISVVKALEVMKHDFMAHFGEGFEDLTSGANETLEDIANYEATKEELKTAIISPIEHREISGAYGVKPTKGILLFGPPGTGKTLMMRALANEIRAGFFYIKASSILSPYSGESAQRISSIFAVAKKHTPCVLFFDEIDGIAGMREAQSEAGKQILSTLLSEMDGFQKIENVVIVGATNAPNLIDPSILRPGRFDKLIYMPLPDAHGRAELFKYYLNKLPVGNDIDFDKLAGITERYSGADIKNVCDEAAREVAEEATAMNKVLELTMKDLIDVIKATKPSTSLSLIEEYTTFKLDYERRLHPELLEKENEEKVSLDSVIGLEDAKKAIYEAVEIPILHPDLVKKYDIRNIKGILLFGPPGTGKTMLLRAVASEIGDVHMITISGAEIAKISSDKALLAIKDAFNRAKENAPSIIFVDEIDAVVPNREHASELGTALTGEFLEELDGLKAASNIVLVGATNRPDSLDSALLRAGRFDKLIFVPPPNEEQRSELFSLYLKKAPLEEDIDFNKLGNETPGLTGADIANLCRQVKMNALEASVTQQKEVKISMKDIEELIEKTKPSAPSMVIGKYLSFLSTYGQR